jgi:trimeric autotransporter adhesin
MRYFRLVICGGILLLLAGAASAQEDYINIYAGGGPNNITATTAPVFAPTNVAFDSAGNVYYTSQGGSNTQMRVWKITKSTGILTIVAGTYNYGYSGDGALAVNAELYNPQGIAVDHSGNIFIADQYNHIIREVNGVTGIITTIAGTPQDACSGPSGCGVTGPATSAKLYYPSGVAIDKNGNLFIANRYNHQIVVVSCATVTSTGATCSPNSSQTAGDIYAVAGDTTAGYAGDGGAATSAELYYPYGIAVDTDGNLFITDTNNYRIREVSCGTGISGCVAASGQTIGDIYTIAGTATAGFAGDSGPATSAELYYPLTAAVDNSGNLFIADQDNYRIREVACVTTTSTGSACTPSTGQTTADIYTVAGNGSGGFTGDMGPATSATVSQPNGVAVDSAGDLIIGDYGNNRIREVPCDVSTLACTPPSGDTAKNMYTIAGTGATTYFGNGIPATGADLYYPSGVASDSSGNIYIADRSNCVVREVNGLTGIITTFAGSGTCGYSGDGGPATSAELNQPYRVAVDSSNNIYIADTANCLIRKVTSGTITTFAGKSPSLACGYAGDGGAATAAELSEPDGVAVDSMGNVYIADQDNYVVRKVSGGTISTFAGDHTYGFAGDGGPAGSAELTYTLDVATDPQGNVYIADQYNHRIRKVNASGIISTYAGNGTAGYQGDGGLAYETSLYYPAGVSVDGAGDVIIADYDNQRVRLVDESNIIHTIAGTGTAGFNGNDILATTAELYQPTGVAVDTSGNVYEADFQNWLVREINALTILNSYPTSASFGTVTKGTTSDPIVLTLNANGTVNIASITPSAQFKETDDCPSTLNSGQSCTVDVQFAPTAPGTVNGTLTISYNGFFSPSLIVPLQGSATSITLTPTSLAFGNQSLNNSVTKTITVKGATTYAATPITFTGDTTDFTLASNTCTGAVTTSCVIGVAFDPKSSGAKKATLVIHDNDPTSPQLAALTGTGTSFESFTPASITFKPTLVNANSTNTKVTFKYTGTGSIMLTGLVASTNFSINYTGLTSGNCSAQPLTLSTNQTCTFNAAFNPGTTLGVIPGTITANFTADANGSTSLQLPVTGTGTEVKITGTLAFGTTTTPVTKSVTITNEGTVTLTFNPAPTISGTGAAEYTIQPYSGSTSTCLNPSTMLTHLQTCTIAVTFNPPAGSGTSYPADLNINDNGGGSPQVVAISGKN